MNTRVNIGLPENLYKKVKILIALKGNTLKEFITEAVIEKLENEQNVNRDFNNKIKKVFQDTDKGIGLIKMNSINELIESYEVDKKSGRLDE